MIKNVEDAVLLVKQSSGSYCVRTYDGKHRSFYVGTSNTVTAKKLDAAIDKAMKARRAYLEKREVIDRYYLKRS